MLSKATLANLEFSDEFEEDTDICSNCGSDTETLIGYNEKLNLFKYECKNCQTVTVVDDESGKRIIIEGKKRDWEEFFSKNLAFPFEGVIDEYSDEEFFGKSVALRFGDRVTVTKIIYEDDLYGVLVEIKKGRRKYHFPLCDIAVADKKSSDYKKVDDYRTWFANCR